MTVKVEVPGDVINDFIRTKIAPAIDGARTDHIIFALLTIVAEIFDSTLEGEELTKVVGELSEMVALRLEKGETIH